MTPEPKDPAAGSTPEPRPPLNVSKEANHEEDLWDLDETAAGSTPLVPVRGRQPDLKTPPTAPGIPAEPKPRPIGHTRVSPSGRRNTPFQVDPNRLPSVGDIGELNNDWEDAVPVADSAPAVPVLTPAPAPPEPAAILPSPSDLPVQPAPAPVAEEPSPKPKPAPAETVPALTSTRLSAGEKIGLAVLAVLLLATATAFVITSWKRLPSDPSLIAETDLPVKGSTITVNQVSTFWRVPTEQDRVRRETKLIPVVSLDVEGGPAGLRVFFRNAQGEVVGDSVTRTAQTGPLEIAATSGFEADGMHAAYRTGESKPWKVEIFEAPSADSNRQDFKKLFEMPISPDRR